MENRSQSNSNRRQSGNRNGGRSRNRQGNPSSGGEGSGSGDRSRSRSRNRSRNRNRGGGGSQPRGAQGSKRPARTPKQTNGQKLLSILTFGLLGKPKPKGRSGRSTGSAKGSRGSGSPATAPKATQAARPADRSKHPRTEVTSGRLYVGNLDYATGETELESLFRGVGNVLSAEVVTNPRTQQSKGFAFVEMGSIDEAKRAVAVLDDQDFMGRKLIVNGARSEGPHSESGEESAMAESGSSQHN
ncbi:MAG: hypothetical protein GXX91_02200 [Verrucomicrobiaceae bacterium]|nr:hypothetical protein [Verrucomicrobiaceae bacterium]